MIQSPVLPDYLDANFKKQVEEIFKPQKITVDLTDLPQGCSFSKSVEIEIKSTKEFGSKFEVLEFLYANGLGDRNARLSEKEWVKEKFGPILTDKLDKLYAENPLAVLVYIISPVKNYHEFNKTISKYKDYVKAINEELDIRAGRRENYTESYYEYFRYKKRTIEDLQQRLKDYTEDIENLPKENQIQIPEYLLKEIENTKTKATSSKDEQNKYYAKEFKLDPVGTTTGGSRGKSDDIKKQEYLKQMAAMAVGQSISRDKNEMHVKKSYAIDNPLHFQVQSADKNYKNLSSFFIDTTKFDKIKEVIKKGLGVNDKIAIKIIFDYMRGYPNKVVRNTEDILSSNVTRSMGVLKDDERRFYCILNIVIQKELKLNYDQINKLFDQNKIKILNNEGKLEEVEIEYKSLAKALVISAVLGDIDTTGAGFTNMGGHVENGKLMFHKIDFDWALIDSKLDMLDVINGQIFLNFKDGDVINGNIYAEAMSKNIPQEYLKQAAIDILSTAGEAMDEYFGHLKDIKGMDPIQFEAIKSRLDSRLSQLQDKIFPILSKDEIKKVMEARTKHLYIPKNPVRRPEEFFDTKESADSGVSEGKIFGKAKRTDKQKSKVQKPIEQPKPETAPELKPETDSGPKLGSSPEQSSGSSNEPNPEQSSDSSSELKPETDSGSKLGSSPQQSSGSSNEPNPEQSSDSSSELKPETDSGSKPELKSHQSQRKEIKLSENSKKILEDVMTGKAYTPQAKPEQAPSSGGSNHNGSGGSNSGNTNHSGHKQNSAIIDITGKDAKEILEIAKSIIQKNITFFKQKFIENEYSGADDLYNEARGYFHHKICYYSIRDNIRKLDDDVKQLKQVLDSAGLQKHSASLMEAYNTSDLYKNLHKSKFLKDMVAIGKTLTIISLSLTALGVGLLVGSGYVGNKSSENPLLNIFYKGAKMAKNHQKAFIIGTVILGFASIMIEFRRKSFNGQWQLHKQKLKGAIDNFQTGVNNRLLA